MQIEDLTIPVERDNYGRLAYHPELHPNHGNRMTEEEREYICKYYGVDDTETIGLALGRTGNTVKNEASRLRRMGLFDYYKNLNKHW